MDAKLKDLVSEHFKLEPELRFVAVFSQDDDNEIRLIEVNASTPATGSVDVFLFAPSDSLPKPIRIAEVTPDEWGQIVNGQIKLPSGWPAKALEQVARPAA